MKKTITKSASPPIGRASRRITLGKIPVTFEVGKLAQQATSSVVATMGETTVLVTVTMAEPREGIDYFPLSVEYIEKFYAGGVISSSRFVKRERFPSDDAILKARLIDHGIRPLFPEGFKNEVQIIVTVLSYDEKNDPGLLAFNAVSLALSISPIPFDGPLGAVKVGLLNDELVLNPNDEKIEESDMELVVSSTKDAITMLEAGAKEVPEDKMLKAIEFAQKHIKPLLKVQDELVKELGEKKVEVEVNELNKKIAKEIEKDYTKKIEKAIYVDERQNRYSGLEEIEDEILEKYKENQEIRKGALSDIVRDIQKKIVKRNILENDKRPDGRKLDEIRKIKCEVDTVPRVHGSGLFNRGNTQALSIVTLGSGRLEQLIEGMEGEDTKRFMHHYNFPPFSTGEAGRYNYHPGRREVGHGAIGERALAPMIPSQEEFPYTIRVVSEILSSDGSTSMAASCASTLALMAAGVPIKEPVAGIGVGLIASDDEKKFKLLTDITGFEDRFGHMDLKMTGTKNGITAIQMDNKLKGITMEILKDAFEISRKGRVAILGKMLKVIPEPRKELAEYAPKIEVITINPAKIGDLIGPGGKIIKGIIEKTGVEIDVEDDGKVAIASPSEEKRAEAKKIVESIVEEAEVGKVYEGTVDKIMPFGFFVNVSPSITGLVHISEIKEGFVSDPAQYVKEGQKIKVKVISIDEDGKVSFSTKRIEGQEMKPREGYRPRPATRRQNGFGNNNRGYRR